MRCPLRRRTTCMKCIKYLYIASVMRGMSGHGVYRNHSEYSLSQSEKASFTAEAITRMIHVLGLLYNRVLVISRPIIIRYSMSCDNLKGRLKSIDCVITYRLIITVGNVYHLQDFHEKYEVPAMKSQNWYTLVGQTFVNVEVDVKELRSTC